MQKIETTQTLLHNAKHASAKKFLQLIKSVISLLDREQHLIGAEIEGKVRRIAPKGEAIIVGDLHGDLENLAIILENSQFIEKAKKRKKQYLIFLGDYGDRGLFSPEVYYVILKLKKMFPAQVILLKGNHEGPDDLMPNPHDLPCQLSEKYGSKATAAIYLQLRKLFGKLYNAVIIDKQYVLLHGGLPNSATSIEDLTLANETHPAKSHLEEILWSDPTEESKGVQDSPRGAGKLFGEDISEKILKMLDVKILIRGHEAASEGYNVSHNGKILTIFSTNKPPYNSCAAYLQLNLAKKFVNANQLVDKLVILKS